MKSFGLLLVSLVFFGPAATSQNSGIINYEYLGIQFTIPAGWVGQEVQGGYLIGSNSDPGFAFLSTMQARTLEEMRQLGHQGIVEEGVYLQPQGLLKQLNSNSLGGLFSGILQGSQVNAFVVGVLNPYGNGVLIIAATSPEMYSDVHEQLATQLANSLIFSEPKTAPMQQQWKQKLSNARLKYMDSYYSGGTGGYDVQREIHLCAEGYFKYRGKSSMTIDTGGTFGNASGNSDGDGTWEIAADYQGNPLLRLTFYAGEVQEYSLSYRDNKTFLNGERYYVTYAHDGIEYAPDCY